MSKRIIAKYFHGETELYRTNHARILVVRKLFPELFPFLGAPSIVRIDSFYCYVGTNDERASHTTVNDESQIGSWVPVTRRVYFNENGSKHKCDARCMGAKGHNCECSCGGKNHGKNR